jgi:hypothetical protein
MHRNLATPTGLEPVASRVTGVCSNQLSYGAKIFNAIHLVVGAVGVEPTKAEPPDLQSSPFGLFGTHPLLNELAERVGLEPTHPLRSPLISSQLPLVLTRLIFPLLLQILI